MTDSLERLKADVGEFWRWIRQPKGAELSIYLLAFYAFLSSIMGVVMRDVLMRWKVEGLACTNVDDKCPVVDVIGTGGCLLLPVLFYQLDTEKVFMGLQIFDMVSVFEFLHPVPSLRKGLVVVKEWYPTAEKICKYSVASENSESSNTLRNFGVILIVSKLSEIFAEEILVDHFMKASDTQSYVFVVICILLKALSVITFTNVDMRQEIGIMEMFTSILTVLKNQDYWLYIYFFLYLSCQNIFNEEIYPSLFYSSYSGPACTSPNTIGLIIGMLFIISLARQYENFNSITPGLIINVITFIVIYIKKPVTSSFFPIFTPETDFLYDQIFPFLLGIVLATMHTELFFLFSTSYPPEISILCATYQFIHRINAKTLPGVYECAGICTTLASLGILSIFGTITILIVSKRDCQDGTEEEQVEKPSVVSSEKPSVVSFEKPSVTSTKKSSVASSKRGSVGSRKSSVESARKRRPKKGKKIPKTSSKSSVDDEEDDGYD